MRGADRVQALRRLHGARESLLLAGVLVVAPIVPALMRLPMPTVDRVLRRTRRRGPGSCPTSASPPSSRSRSSSRTPSCAAAA